MNTHAFHLSTNIHVHISVYTISSVTSRDVRWTDCLSLNSGSTLHLSVFWSSPLEYAGENNCTSYLIVNIKWAHTFKVLRLLFEMY